jgi:lipid-A-disaccharide synthase
VRPSLEKREAQAGFELHPRGRVVGLFPGSRKAEIEKLLPVVLESARLLKDRLPDLQFLLPLASSLRLEDISAQVEASGLPVRIVSGRNHDVMVACDAAISVSGTVTMELALVGVPMVIIYRVSALTYEIGKRVIQVPHIGICNIVAEKRVVKELIQHEAEPQGIAAEIERLLTDEGYRSQVREGLAGVRVKLGNGGALQRLAQVALGMMDLQKESN